MRSNSENPLYWLFSDRIPLTKLLLVSNAVTFVLMALVGPLARGLAIAYVHTDVLIWMPWSLFTYPFINGCGTSILCILFSCYWLWIAGGSVERSWGTRTFAIFFFLMSAISALGIALGAWLVGPEQLLGGMTVVGLALPLAGLTVAFGMLNPEQVILLFLIIPVKLKYVAALGAAGILIGYGQINIVLGIFGLSGCAFAFWYVRSGIQYGFEMPHRSRPQQVVRVYERRSLLSRLNPFEWIRRRRQTNRLRKLFEDSDRNEGNR